MIVTNVWLNKINTDNHINTNKQMVTYCKNFFKYCLLQFDHVHGSECWFNCFVIILPEDVSSGKFAQYELSSCGIANLQYKNKVRIFSNLKK